MKTYDMAIRQFGSSTIMYRVSVVAHESDAAVRMARKCITTSDVRKSAIYDVFQVRPATRDEVGVTTVY